MRSPCLPHIKPNLCPAHHWLIARPEGALSEGRCKWCGERREFRNSNDFYGPERRVAAHTMYATPGERMAEALRE